MWININTWYKRTSRCNLTLAWHCWIKFIRRSCSLKEKPRLIMKTKPSIQEPVRADINWSRRLQRLLSVSPFNLLGSRVALTYLSGSNLLSGALWVATLEGVERLCYIAVISDPRRLFELKCYLIYSLYFDLRVWK